jgi:hypothetical protein
MPKVRTTVTTDEEVLGALRAEASRRGVPLNAILAEAIDEKSRALRAQRKPRLGVGRSTDGESAAEYAVDPVAEPLN